MRNNSAPRPEPDRRKLALLLRACAAPLVALAVFAIWEYLHRSPVHEIIVLIADLDAPDSEREQLTSALVDSLRRDADESDNIRLLRLREVLDEEKGQGLARGRGREYQAMLVIWGSYTQGVATLHFELLQSPGIYRVEPGRKETLQVAAAVPRSIRLREPRSSDMRRAGWMMLSFARYVSQDFAGATLCLSRLLDATDDMNQVVDSSQVYLYRGISHHYRHRIEGGEEFIAHAISDYSRAISLNSDSPAAHFNRALALFDTGDHEGAITACDRSITLNPNDAESYFLRANSWAERGEFSLALADYSRVTAIDPAHVGAYINRGDIYLSRGEYEAAISDYTRVIDVRPGMAAAFQGRGESHAGLGNRASALADFSEALKVARRPEQRETALRAIEALEGG